MSKSTKFFRGVTVAFFAAFILSAVISGVVGGCQGNGDYRYKVDTISPPGYSVEFTCNAIAVNGKGVYDTSITSDGAQQSFVYKEQGKATIVKHATWTLSGQYPETSEQIEASGTIELNIKGVIGELKLYFAYALIVSMAIFIILARIGSHKEFLKVWK